MDQIRETLGKLADLSEDELTALTDSIVTEFESVQSEDLSPQAVESMTELASALETVSAEKSRREQELQELSRLRDEAAAKVKGINGEAESADDDAEVEESEPVAEPVTAAATEDTPAETESKAAPTELAAEAPAAAAEKSNPVTEASAADEPKVEEPEHVEEEAPEATDPAEVTEADEKAAEDVKNAEEEAAAAVDTAKSEAEAEADAHTEEGKDPEAPMTASADQGPEVQAPADRRATPKITTQVAITAGADIPGVTAGSGLPNMAAISEAFTKRLHGMRRTTGGDGEQHVVATLTASYPEDRVLRDGEPEANNKKIDAVASPQAITAAGGFCAPVEVSYDIFGFGVSDRPVKDALATFSADRGGIRYTTPPRLGDLDGAVSTWTLQDDIDAATPGAPDPTKPCLRVVCGSEIVVQVDAIPLCLTFGNLQTRAFPEQVARNNELAMITHARYAETRLLTRIGTLSTQVTAAQKLGAARDFLRQVDRAGAAYRNRHRLSDTESLRVVAPLWLKNMIRGDLVANMPGDGHEESFALADAKINNWFTVRHINPSWTLDGESGQIFGAQANGALLDYPDNVVWYLFAEGTFLFLDGGTLDLGLVRDSTLNATNDYKMFVETFEGVAKVGIESLRVNSRLEPNGAVSGTIDPTTVTS